MNFMDLDEFETQVKASIDLTLNHLQVDVLASAHLKQQVTTAGQAVQQLDQLIEQFIATQRSNSKEA